MMYFELKAILEQMARAAEKLNQSDSRVLREKGHELLQEARNLIFGFAYICSKQGCKFDSVRKEFEDIVGGVGQVKWD